MPKLKVLVLCTGNSCRSILTEALLRRRAGDRFEVSSAGTEPKGIHPLTKQVLEEVEIDTSGLRSKSLAEFLGKDVFHYVIIVCHSADETCPRIFPGMRERLYWPFDDPPATVGDESQKLAKFREVRDAIDRRLADWIAELDRTATAALNDKS